MMPVRPRAAAALLSAACWAAGAAATQAAAGWHSSSARYACEGGIGALAVYLNLETGGSFASLYYQNELVLLRQDAAASGARYVAVDGQAGYRWHTKADDAVLSALPAGGAQAEILLNTCKRIQDD